MKIIKLKRKIVAMITSAVIGIASIPMVTLAANTYQDGIKVTRTVKEVEGKKNVWEVTVQIDSEGLVAKQSADVIFVTDRSGSMGVASGTSTRASVVKSAAAKLGEELLKEANIKIGVVSYGGGQNTSTKETKQVTHYDDAWTPITVKYSYGETYSHGRCTNIVHKCDYGWYPDTRTDVNLTSSISIFKNGLEKALKSVSGGTPTSMGIIEAARLLEKSTSDNKFIVLLSDGEPTYARDGQGERPGNWSGFSQGERERIEEDTVNAARQAEKKGIKLYTVSAGGNIGKDGKRIMERVATKEGYAFASEDTQAALESVMKNISSDISNQVNGATYVDVLSSQFEMQVTDTMLQSSVSQGKLIYNETQGCTWEIGKLNQGVPAILKYYIRLVDGQLGTAYPINDATNRAELSYTNASGEIITKSTESHYDNLANNAPDIANPSIKASWAKVSIISNNIKQELVEEPIREADGSIHGFSLWYKVPSSLVQGGSLQLSPNTKVNSATLEVDTTASTTIRSINAIDQYDFLGVKLPSGTYELAGNIEIDKVNSSMILGYNKAIGCNCSTVWGRIIEYTHKRYRFNPANDCYDVNNFKDDVREGIHEAIKSGSEYEYELAKFEIKLLLDKYGNTAKMLSEGKTSTDIVNEIVRVIDRKYAESKDLSTARQEGANVWNNIINNYITFGTKAVTLESYKDILKSLGIGDVDSKSLEQIQTQLMHKHESAGVRDCHEEGCGNQVCIDKNQPPNSIINEAYKTYPAHITAKLSEAINLDGNTTVKLGVNSNNIVEECTCRIGAIGEITTLPPEIDGVYTNNFIQPEGVTNIGVKIEFKEYVKDVVYTINVEELINEKLDGNTLMTFDLSRATADVLMVTGTTTTRISKNQFTVQEGTDGKTISVIFKKSTDTNAFFANKNSVYKISVYIPTKMGSNIVYGTTTGNANNYLTQYINNPLKVNQEVEASITATPRVKEAYTDVNGVSHPATYDVPKTSNITTILLKYIQMSKIS